MTAILYVQLALATKKLNLRNFTLSILRLTKNESYGPLGRGLIQLFELSIIIMSPRVQHLADLELFSGFLVVIEIFGNVLNTVCAFFNRIHYLIPKEWSQAQAHVKV